MKKILLALIAVLATIPALFGQQFKIEKSLPFEEPEYGWNRVIQLRNGNTFFFHTTKKEGINVVVYNKDRKVIGKRTLVSKKWDAEKMKTAQFKGFYEINGEPVIFVSQPDGREPVLYRMRLNPTTGFIAKEDEIGRMPKVSLFAGYAVAFGGVDPFDFFVEKDAESDHYAVITYNSLAPNTDERIKVQYYDATHKKIGEAYYRSPGGAFKYLQYLGAVVDGNKRMYVTSYAYNEARGGSATPKLIVSRLNVGDTSFTHSVLELTEEFEEAKAIMQYNRNNNKLQLLTLTLDKKKGGFNGKTTSYYSVAINYIDPETLKLVLSKPVSGQKITAYGVEHIDKKFEYSGMPQHMIINKDKTTTILFEESSETTYRSLVRTQLGSIGISELSDFSTELRGYAISKRQQAEDAFPKLYIWRRSKGMFQFSQHIEIGDVNVNQYLSYDYVNSDKGRFVIFNDLPGNAEKGEEDEKRKIVARVSETNTICYKLNEGRMDKFYLFGDPTGKDASTFCDIACSDFNKETNTYATIIVERNGREKKAKVAWVTFE
ncbi:MAG: hypothetical protein K0Q79_888 [Flavipsychrobacter sp.]|jgi:hypothetical protein|nr:hypothetical protein [Flavipsychrobacter sp.]